VAGNSNEVGRSVTSKVVAILETFFHGSIHSLTEIAHHTELPTYPQVRWVGPWGSNPQPVDQRTLHRDDDGPYLRLRPDCVPTSPTGGPG
jgi:hypothetical protein